MATELRLILIEDRAPDVELIVRELRRGGYDARCARVESTDELATTLSHGAWDLVLCDWVLPELTALGALAQCHQHDPDLPFIVVSGVVGEEVAVSAMKAGAHDFVGKHRLARLVPAIERELREAEARRARRRAEAALRSSERRYRELVETAHDLVYAIDSRGLFTFVNNAARFFGYEPQDLVGRSFIDLLAPAHAARHQRAFELVKAGGLLTGYEAEVARRDGTTVLLSFNVSPLRDHDGTVIGATGSAVDISSRKHTDDVARANEERLRLCVEHCPAVVALFDGTMRYLMVSQRWLLAYHLVGKEVIGRCHHDVFPHLSQRWKDRVARTLEGTAQRGDEPGLPWRDASDSPTRWEMHPWRDAAGAIGGVVMFTESISSAPTPPQRSPLG